VKFRVLLVLLALLTASTVEAKTKLPNVFSDHMVVQQKMPIHVWGWTNPGQDVTVELGGKSVSGKADASGRLTFRFRPLMPAAPRTRSPSWPTRL